MGLEPQRREWGSNRYNTCAGKLSVRVALSKTQGTVKWVVACAASVRRPAGVRGCVLRQSTTGCINFWQFGTLGTGMDTSCDNEPALQRAPPSARD